MWADDKCCIKTSAGKAHDPCDTSPVQPYIYPSTSRHGSATASERQNTFPTCFCFPLLVMEAGERGEPRMEAALGWRCANGERVHSPTHPFPVLSRSIIVERWRWEPRSLPTPTPAAPPSAAAQQPLTVAVYASIYTSIHRFFHPYVSIKKRVVVCKEVVVFSVVSASCQKADIVSMKPLLLVQTFKGSCSRFRVLILKAWNSQVGSHVV